MLPEPDADGIIRVKWYRDEVHVDWDKKMMENAIAIFGMEGARTVFMGAAIHDPEARRTLRRFNREFYNKETA